MPRSRADLRILEILWTVVSHLLSKFSLLPSPSSHGAVSLPDCPKCKSTPSFLSNNATSAIRFVSLCFKLLQIHLTKATQFYFHTSTKFQKERKERNPPPLPKAMLFKSNPQLKRERNQFIQEVWAIYIKRPEREKVLTYLPFHREAPFYYNHNPYYFK